MQSYLTLSPRLTYDENNDITGTALNNLMPYEGAIFLAFPHFTFQHLATCVFQYSSLSLCLSECNDVCVCDCVGELFMSALVIFIRTLLRISNIHKNRNGVRIVEKIYITVV